MTDPVQQQSFGGLPTELAWKIFIDRYTIKDQDRRFAVGDLAVVQTNDDIKWPKKELGIVREIDAGHEQLTVELLTGPDKGDVLKRQRWECDRPLETSLQQVADRIATGLAEAESDPAARERWRQVFAEEISQLRVVPGGRVWAGAGTGIPLTLFNCYVIPNPRDSRQGIVETLGQMIEIMSRGGGVGINVSSLRPYRAVVKGVNGRSSGAVSWMELYSLATGLVEQGGCFGPDERIATDKGLIPAAELYERLGSGEKLHAQTHAGYKPITARFANGIKQLYRVTTASGLTVEVTADHKMGVMDGDAVTTVPLKELAVGDEILTLLGEHVPGEQIALQAVDRFPAYLEPRLSYLLGYMYGDASVRSGQAVSPGAAKAIQLAVPHGCPQVLERLVRWSWAVFGLEPAVEQGDGDCYSVVLNSQLLVQWLDQNDLLTERDQAFRVPEAVFRAGSEIMGAFVAGYYDAAGSDQDRGDGYGFDSVSPGMLRDLQQLLAANGIASRLATADRGIYRLAVSGTDFTERINQFTALALRNKPQPCSGNPELNDRPAVLRRPSDTGVRGRLAAAGQAVGVMTMKPESRVLPDHIVSIEPSKTCAVYDFEVAGTHMLAGNGIYTSNSRRGALMLQLDIRHPDWQRFVDCKKEAGKVENANISLRITDEFMAAVKADKPWTFWFPDTTHPDYDEVWTGDFDDWERRGLPKVEYETLPARQVWQEIIKGAWESAEPGIVFSSRHEQDSNSWYFNRLVCTNPCVTGDTLIYTAQGLRRAADLFMESEPNAVVADGRMCDKATLPASAVFMTGIKPVFRLVTREGYEVRLTADHQVMTDRGWVAAKDLVDGDAIHVLNRPGQFGTEGSYDLGIVLAWLTGDGTLKRDRAELSCWGAGKQELAPVLAAAVSRVVRPSLNNRQCSVGAVNVLERNEVRVQPEHLLELAERHRLTEHRASVPEAVFLGKREMQVGFIQALFSADGHIERSTRSGNALVLSSKSIPFLQDVQRLLLNFSIFSCIDHDRGAAARRQTPDGLGGRGEFQAEALHSLRVTGPALLRFREEIGLLQQSKQRELDAIAQSYQRDPDTERFTAAFKALVPDGTEPVFDLTVPGIHAFVANGLVVHNCAEQPLPAWGVCTLGHLNLAKMFDEEAKDVDWQQLRTSIRALVRLLDNVVDVTHYFIDENRENQMRERRIGAGTLGLGELLIRLGLRYGSAEAVAFTDRLYRFIAVEAYLASVDLAKEKGSFPAFDAEKYLQSGFVRRLPEEVRSAIREHGIRNVTVLTQAPTGTVGTMLDTSTGIEPFYSLQFYRQSRLGVDLQYVRVAQQWLDEHPGQALPGYFVGAMDLTPEEHIAMQAAIQRWTDSSISKTANAPADYTVDQTAELYMKAYDLGCKGVTVYRDRSRQEQVLHDASKKSEAESSAESAPAVDAVTGFQVNGTWGSIKPVPRPARLSGVTMRKPTPLGNIYVTLNTYEGRPFELFAQIGKAGSDVGAFTEAIARLASLAFRCGVDPQDVADQLAAIGGSQSLGFGARRVRSVPDAIAQALGEYLAGNGVEDPIALQAQGQTSVFDAGADVSGIAGGSGSGSGSTAPVSAAGPVAGGGVGRTGAVLGALSSNGARYSYNLCPECGSMAYVYQEGCAHCMACGHSEC